MADVEDCVSDLLDRVSSDLDKVSLGTNENVSEPRK